MEAEVAYGEGTRAISLPRSIAADVIEPAEAPPLSDVSAAVRAALAAPLGSPPLAALAAGKKSALLAVPDGTRPIPLETILPPLLEALAPSIAPEKMLLLFATGMHRPVTAPEARRLLGVRLAGTLRWESHDPGRTKRLGRTARGTAIDVHESFLAADLRIAVGLVRPHLLAGFSGGRKLVAPGLVSLETMRVLHGPEIVGHAKAHAGVLEENPMHEEAVAIARAAGLHFALHLTADRKNRVTGVAAGDFDVSHRAICRALARSARVTAPGGHDLVITGGGGAPSDATFYQSVKGIVAAAPLVKRGGAILLSASCEEGWGSDDFVELLREAPDLASFLDRARRPGAFRKDQWMVQHLREAMEHLRVYLDAEHLDREEAARFGLAPVSSPAEGIARALEGIARPSVALLPDGPHTWVRARRPG